MKALFSLMAALCLLWVPLPARAERLVTTISNNNVEVTSSFAGETLNFFGNIEADAGSAGTPVKGPYNIIIVVTGPLGERVARLQAPRFGIWLNSAQVRFKDFPTYFQVLASGRLEDVTDTVTLNVEGILPETQAKPVPEEGWWDAAIFGPQLVRLMTEQGFFGVRTDAVNFLSETAYSARLTLPHDVANGQFLAQTFLFKNGELISKKTEGFRVHKTGLERFIGSAAQDYPLVYGFVCVLLAVFTGWLGGVVFRR